jgi:flagellar hook-associated protein 3
MLYRSITSNVMGNKESIYALQQQIASGRKISRASDDPGAFEVINKQKSDASNIEQYNANADLAESKLLNLDSLLQSMIQTFQRASEIAITASDSTVENRDALGNEINQLLESVVSLANTTDNGSYVFSGLRSDTVPYLAEDTNSDGMIDKITYQGSDKVLQAEVGRGSYVPINIPGSDLTGSDGVFQTKTQDLFSSLMQLRDRLMVKENPVEGESFTTDHTSNTLFTQKIYTTGSRVDLSTTGTLPAGLSADTTYYAIKISDTEIKLATSLDNARNGVAVDFTDDGSGEHTINQDIITDLNESLNHLTNMIAIVGAREERIDIHTDILSERTEAINEILDKKESLDVAEAMVQLSARQFTYEAALNASSKLLNSASLLDYI